MRTVQQWFRQLDGWLRRLLVVSTVLAVVGAVLFYTPTPYYVTAPGAAIDTSRLIAAEGGQPNRGHLYMLVVTSQPANLFWYLYSKVDNRAQLETREQFLGSVENYGTYVELTKKMMTDSRRIARAVALQQLGYGQGVRSVGVHVAGILAESPARGRLQVDDVILAINGRQVASSAELRDRLRQMEPGAELALQIQREGKEMAVQVTAMASPDPERKGTAALGVTIQDELHYDDQAVPVQIRSGAITGPSAGLMFTLQIIDQLTPGGLVGDRVVAGTGTIEPDGSIGAIGGVQQKVYTAEAAGAEVLFVPRSNYGAATAVATKIEVVPVDHVRDAIQWLQADRNRA